MGESEFIFFAKQITEKVEDLNLDDVNYKLSTSSGTVYMIFS